MSTDMLRVIGVADLPRSQQSQSAARPQESRAVPQGRGVAAASGERLPPSAEQDPAKEAAKVEQAVSQINELVQNMNRDLHFSVDKDSGKTVIKVLDSETKEVIRQIPSEELLRIAKAMMESNSLLLKEQA